MFQECGIAATLWCTALSGRITCCSVSIGSLKSSDSEEASLLNTPACQVSRTKRLLLHDCCQPCMNRLTVKRWGASPFITATQHRALRFPFNESQMFSLLSQASLLASTLSLRLHQCVSRKGHLPQVWETPIERWSGRGFSPSNGH